MNRSALTVLLTAGLAMPSGAAWADLRQAIADGETALSVRYRFETVDQDGIDKNAKASTARARWTFDTAQAGAWSLGLEADYAMTLGIEQFNSTTNGNTDFPVVADPEGFDLNRAFVKYVRDGFTMTFGRQRINHGTQRIVGGVAYRQNEQTYDALRLQGGDGFNWDYTYLHNVNRIFGPHGSAGQPSDWYGNSHLFRFNTSPFDNHTITAFGYMLDFENASGPAFSNITYGVEYEAKVDALSIHASIARQSDYGDNPVSFDAPFYSVQADYKHESMAVTLGWQSLGSDDGMMGFRTPLGTLHKFQGWTDRFLVTPNNGVDDRWFSVSAKAGSGNVALAYHDFRSTEGDMDYGSEIGASFTYPVHEKVGLLVKAARYSADEHATDISKVWIQFLWQM